MIFTPQIVILAVANLRIFVTAFPQWTPDMRTPSDLSLYYTYWYKALVNLTEADAWRLENERRLSFWDDLPMIFPGFYRYQFTGRSEKMKGLKGQFLPVSIWIEQQISEATGELLNDEELIMKTGHWDPDHAARAGNMMGEVKLLMTWEKCRLHPVTEEMYNFAMDSFARTSAFVWYDTKPGPEAPAQKPEPVELREVRSLF